MLCIRCKAEIDKSFRACPHCGETITEFSRRYTDELLDSKYRILERLGTGGMGEVYKAEHTYLGATRVIKVIRPQISESQDAHDRFLREARVATRVQDTNVATLHDFSALPDGSHYMVWEYIDGENLAQRLRTRTTLPPRSAVRLAIQALHGLDAIHRAGIVHRDISPENLMITRETDTVKIIDLGVAKIDDPTETAATRTGIFVGKLRYAAPEQLGFLGENEKVDARVDIYAMAMVLYEMLAGRPPFEATSPHQFYMHHSEEKEFQPVDLPPDLPGGADLQAALRKALQRDRNKRFSSAREFAAALEAVEKSLPDPAATRTVAVAFNSDETMKVAPRVDTQHRSTVRSEVSGAPAASAGGRTTPTPRAAEAAVAPHIPSKAPAAATVITSVGEAPRKRTSPLAILALFAFLIGAVILGAWLVTRKREPRPPIVGGPVTSATTTTTAPATATIAEAVPSTTILEITPPATDPTATTPVLAAPTATAPTATVAPVPVVTETRAATPPKVIPPKPEPRPEPRPEPAKPVEERPAVVEDIADNTYIARGDEDANEQVLERLRQSLRGTRRIAVRGGDMQSELVTQLQDEFPSVEITDRANVIIEFNGQTEQLQRGRKTRAARATIRKNGRVIFRYVMQREMYRVGNTPVEAFVGVLSEAFEE